MLPAALPSLILSIALAQPLPPPSPASDIVPFNAMVRVAWDASPSGDRAQGYRLHWGYASGQYSANKDCGTNLVSDVKNLRFCASPIYFSVVAYAIDDEYDSEFSDELVLTLPGFERHTIITTLLESSDSPTGPWQAIKTFPVCVETNSFYIANPTSVPARFYRSRVSVRQE